MAVDIGIEMKWIELTSTCMEIIFLKKIFCLHGLYKQIPVLKGLSST